MPIIIHDEIWEKLLSAIASGLTEQDACQVVGVGRTTLHEKKKKDAVYKEEVRKANIVFKLKHIQNIAEHSKTSWQSSAWLLERKFPNEFGTQSRIDITSGGRTLAPPSWFGAQLGSDVEDAEVIEDEETT